MFKEIKTVLGENAFGSPFLHLPTGAERNIYGYRICKQMYRGDGRKYKRVLKENIYTDDGRKYVRVMEENINVRWKKQYLIKTYGHNFTI